MQINSPRSTALIFVLIKLVFILVGWIAMGPHSTVTYPHGTPLGANRGVVAFSNGGTATLSTEGNDVRGTYSGLKWQCVEYARRWLMLIKNVTFRDVDIAHDIWSLPHFETFLGKHSDSPRPVGVVRHRTGQALRCPGVGDLLIWPVSDAIGPYGHVAVITGVNQTHVELTEQNYDDTVRWMGQRDHSRSLPLSTIESGDKGSSGGEGDLSSYSSYYYSIESPEPLLGWIALDDTPTR